MYSITIQKDGKYLSEARIQDETLRRVCATEEEAVEHCKSVARNCNGTKIKRKDITFFREAERVVTVREKLG